MTVEEVRRALLGRAGEVRAFTEMIVPGSQNVLGIRLPELRKLAKQIVAGDPRTYLERNPQEYYEERLLQCFVLGAAKDEFDYLLGQFLREIPYVDNWAVNDALCMDFKICRKHRAETLAAIEPLFSSHREFEVRVAAVMLLCHFVTPEYLQTVVEVLDRLDTKEYYASMGVAWAAAEAAVKFPDRGLAWLETCRLDEKTRRRAIQKALESFRVSPADKEKLRALRNKK